MTVFVDVKYRIKRNSIYEKEMDELRKAKLFSSFRDILVLSAVIGYANNRFIPIEKPAQDGVLMQFFSHEDRNLMDLLAFIKTKDQKILHEAEKYHYFEGYANGGFPILLNLLCWVGGEEYVLSVDRKEVLIDLYTKLVTDDYILNDKDFLEDL
jgi:dnd system-associated protein 4